MANNLKDHLKEVADAIRAKKGTSDLINPQDFATEIEGITSGSGGEGGSSTIEYLDLSGVEDLIQGQIPLRILILGYSYRCKYNHPNGSGIKVELVSQITSWMDDIISLELLASEIDFKANSAADKFGQYSIEEVFLSIGVSQEQLDSIPRITKEQFYDLNA